MLSFFTPLTVQTSVPAVQDGVYGAVYSGVRWCTGGAGVREDTHHILPHSTVPYPQSRTHSPASLFVKAAEHS